MIVHGFLNSGKEKLIKNILKIFLKFLAFEKKRFIWQENGYSQIIAFILNVLKNQCGKNCQHRVKKERVVNMYLRYLNNDFLKNPA